MQKIASDKIVRILRELTPSHRRNQMMNTVGRHEEQKQATDQLGKAVEAFGDDADRKEAVQESLGLNMITVPAAIEIRSFSSGVGGAERCVDVFGVGLESFLATLQGRGRVGCCRNRQQIAAP